MRFARNSLQLSLLVCGGLFMACETPCEFGVPGDSEVNFPIPDGESVTGDGQAAGLWQVTLDPASGLTSCVDARELPNEVYVYTLEFRGDEDVHRARILVDGFPLVEDGEYDAQTQILTFTTVVREDLERDGGAITYEISGSVSLYADAGELVWLGTETLTVLTSEDPDVPAGCDFVYNVNGFKVCDE